MRGRATITLIGGLTALLVVVPGTPQGVGAATNGVVVVGEFSDMRFTAEHAYGYSVQLWRQGDQLFGLLLASEGLQGDTPTGLLEEIKFDTHTKALSFTAKLTTGVTLLGSGPPFKEVPVCERFAFRGNLGPGMLAGTMNRDRLQPTKEHGSTQTVRLRKVDAHRMIRPATYGEWKMWVDDILKLRGPKC